MDDTIFDMAIRAKNDKLFDGMKRTLNTPSSNEIKAYNNSKNKKVYEDMEKNFEQMGYEPGSYNNNTNTPSDFVPHEVDEVCLVVRTRHTVRLKCNTTCGDVKKILDKVPDKSVISTISVDDDFYITEIYFDIEEQNG